ncbi:hypothetical protein [Crateriforma conspicua]|uniref:Uncharacterized protein n=1 Tax=Crateriforma conspicua TaxID=2527996 RepID=A0A5C5XSB9_9PLAN|nr:hypothetical protein [Crateriforma conspicua]TWT64935.1 hypothetical protein Pan14r_54370 [Crateriforma conspicua]
MKYKLRSLMAFVTVACVLLVIAIQIVAHQRRIQQWHTSFQTLYQDTQTRTLGPDLKAQLTSYPEMKTRDGGFIQINYGSGSETQDLAREFDYYWQLPDGTRSDGIRLTLDAERTKERLTAHVVHLRYEDHPLNNRIAQWIEKRLTSSEFVTVKHQTSKKPVPSINSAAHPVNSVARN